VAAKTTEQVYKNIQVLKRVPADQLIPSMQFVTASLGVHCDFCHVERAFEKDDKETKQTARKMMRMMFAINEDNFDGRALRGVDPVSMTGKNESDLRERARLERNT
jgi:hypothetical protein